MAVISGDLTDSELALMRLLWDNGPQTMRQIAESLYRDGGPSQYSLVQKVVDRLEQKGFVKKIPKTWPYLFEAAGDRTKVAASMAANAIVKVLAGSAVFGTGPVFAVLVGGIYAALTPALFERLGPRRASPDDSAENTSEQNPEK